MGSDHKEMQWQRSVVSLKSLHHANHFKWHVTALSGFRWIGWFRVSTGPRNYGHEKSESILINR